MNRYRTLTVLAGVLAGVGFLVAANLASAQAYPGKPIKFILPFPPGGAADTISRIVAREWTDALGQPVIVESRIGAGGTLGTEAAAKSAPDGYTLALGTISTLGMAPSFHANLNYDPVKSFAPVSLICSAPYLIVVHASVAGSLKELIDSARSKPGRLNYGSSGNGTLLHVAAEMFKSMTGTDIVHIPYKGGSQTVPALLSGQVDVLFDQLASFQLEMFRNGRLKPLAVASAARIAQLPDVPTVAEAGLPGFDIAVWFGVVAPKGTPASVIARLNSEMHKALATKRVHDAIAGQGVEPKASTPEQFSALIAAENAKWSQFVRQSGLKFD